MLINNNLLIDYTKNWLKEDVGNFDLTSQIIIDPGIHKTFNLVVREPAIISGLEVAQSIFHQVDSELEFETFCNDKDRVKSGFKIAVVSGNASAILTAERVVLNILQRMCGIATITNDYVKAISHTKARLVDTRKTTPGLRLFEKYAFYCGGGGNHRFGLDSGVMLKDNHIALFGNIFEAVKRIKERAPILTKVEVECDTVPQVEASINAGADLIMLDNMSSSEMERAVNLVNNSIPLECSGNVNLDNIGEKAMTGVNYISVGAITQSARCIDIGLDV